MPNDPIAENNERIAQLERRAATGDAEAQRLLRDANERGDALIFFQYLRNLNGGRWTRDQLVEFLREDKGWDESKFSQVEARARREGYDVRYRAEDVEAPSTYLPPPESKWDRQRRMQYEAVHRAAADLSARFQRAVHDWFVARDQLLATGAKGENLERELRAFEIDVREKEARAQRRAAELPANRRRLDDRIAIIRRARPTDQAGQRELQRQLDAVNTELRELERVAEADRVLLETNRRRRDAFAQRRATIDRERQERERVLATRKQEMNRAEDAFRERENALYDTFEDPDKPDDLQQWLRGRHYLD